MTANQVAYWNYRESERHNVATEQELRRSNIAKETENMRANRENEVIQRQSIQSHETVASLDRQQKDVASKRQTASSVIGSLLRLI